MDPVQVGIQGLKSSTRIEVTENPVLFIKLQKCPKTL